jgi:hypothetical protein
MDSVIERSLERMVSMEIGGMHCLIMKESLGGNGGVRYGYKCTGTNFCVDNESGEIKYFENHQHIPSELKDLKTDIFRIAFRFPDFTEDEVDSRWYRIVDYDPSKYLADKVHSILIRTVEVYNERYGFELK